jgi:hypothetical protein
MRVLGVAWFNGRSAIGIVVCYNKTENRIKAYIHTVHSRDEEQNITAISEWGSQFPVKEAVAIIEKRGTIKVPAKEWVKLIHSNNESKT